MPVRCLRKPMKLTATRLSNGACRGVEQKGSGSILVSGMEGVEAALTGVDTDHFLTVESTGNRQLCRCLEAGNAGRNADGFYSL